MKGAKVLEALAVNIVLLLGIYFVLGDVATRTAYAAGKGMSYTFAQLFLVETSTLQGSSGGLQSPLTLDWVQLLLVVLVVVDVLYFYGWLERRRATPKAA